MNGLLIKIGKAKLLWKRSGLIGGMKILSSYFSTFLKAFFVGSGDVLFVSSGVGDSAQYRAYNPAEELRLHGFNAKTTIADNPMLGRLAKKFKVFIFHRTVLNKNIERLINEAKKLNKEIIFDTDDLVYDPKHLIHMDYFQNMSAAEQELYKKGIGAEIVNDPYVKTCTTTVAYLAEKLKEKNKRVIIVPNKFSKKELAIVNSTLDQEKQNDGFVRIIYCSGTLSHNKDFATIKDSLLEVLNKHEKVKLVIVGLLDLPDELARQKSRLEIVPRLTRKELYKKIYEADINLAPLEINNPFCDSKSAIKFTEAGALKIPTVAVRNQTFSEAIDDGVDGFLADSTEEWTNKLGKLIEDSALRKEMGEKARQKVLKKYTNENSSNEEYYEFIRSSCNS